MVLDCSVVVDWLLRRPAAAFVDELLASGRSVHVPQLLFVEAAQVMRRLTLSGQITAARGDQAITDLSDLPLSSYPHEPFLPRIWELRANVSAYDAVYLALAEVLEVPLMTLDHPLALAGRAHAACEIVEPD